MNAVVIKTYTNDGEAELESGMLRAEGVWSMVRRELGSLYIGWFPGAVLVVRPEDLEKAKDILGLH